MSVMPASGPDPSFYSYPSTLPSALTTPVASSSAPAAASTSASPLSAYESEYDTLQQDDAAELMQVSLGSTANAQSNLASVLAQAAALQDQQLAAQQQQAAAASSTAGASSASDPLNLPSLQSLFAQSDSDASNNLSNYQSSGSSIDLLA